MNDLLEQHYLEAYLNRVRRYKVIGRHEGADVVSLYQPPMASQAGERALRMRVRRRFEGGRIPASATIAVNKACQCACEHCSAVHYNHDAKANLSTEDLKRAIRETVELGATTIILLGGEPLLRRDLLDVIADVRKDQASVILFTNGEFLSETRSRELKAAGLMGAFVSLDSDIPEDHDRLRRRPGLFEKAIQGVKHLRAAGVLVGISSYLSPEQLANGMLDRMMELGKKVGACEVTFFDAIPSGRWLHETSCLLGEEDRALIRDAVRVYRSKADYPGISAQSTMTSEEGSAFCFAANTQFYLTAWGEMCPCDFTPLSIGAFPEHSIRDLWSKMTTCAPYDVRAKSCRMQDPAFHRDYIAKIPKEGPFPYPIQSL